ncbi:hypothetical protein BU26DRAFT_167432 [Trematosphaeria pertusa]|uniref:Tc toxin complex TcA C-terminal TcB-binding domain-containing protein n=1 Tax=Trematosphaeria pertusa TaxID=390896 RepID=A0A6A6HVE6_9PLEO|nr:uncharacterized protein BU26DRAFT_167432 [Trematosphaeria pertusa]KAF2242165.1 hypothetical protein BU26DRAFT_167432 [Trematosphaeria pertusa]
MTSNEKLGMDRADQAVALNQRAALVDFGASILTAIPDIGERAEPLRVGISIGSITKNLAEGMSLAVSVMGQEDLMQSAEGVRASRKESFIRQLQERRMQANVAGRDIKVTDKQIEATKVRLEMCERDIKLQQQRVAHIVEMEEWHNNKYTSERLYAWMDNSVRSLFYQMHVLANDLAKKAQKAFRFERGEPGIEYIGQSYWDNGRDGLLSGEPLYLALKRLEAAYLERRNHDFEIVKNISLRQIQPWALINLRETGTVEFSILEPFFDFDFPD